MPDRVLLPGLRPRPPPSLHTPARWMRGQAGNLPLDRCGSQGLRAPCPTGSLVFGDLGPRKGLPSPDLRDPGLTPSRAPPVMALWLQTELCGLTRGTSLDSTSWQPGLSGPSSAQSPFREISLLPGWGRGWGWGVEGLREGRAPMGQHGLRGREGSIRREWRGEAPRVTHRRRHEKVWKEGEPDAYRLIQRLSLG